MCGFVFAIGRNGRVPDPAMVARMTETLSHRGPDDTGFWSEGPVAIGFRRLAIIDPTPAGHQPMVSADGRHVLVLNGEVYNYVELRDELRALGARFRSTSDSEVLLAAWRQWGPDALSKLVGMFAFVIWDRKGAVVHGARDRLGIKPLYVHRGPDITILASEIKALHASGLDTYRENWPVLAHYLVSGEIDDGVSTCFHGIEQVAASHAFEIGPSGIVRQRRYFDWPTQVEDLGDETPARIGDLFEHSVRLRMRSDVPVGVCLSGGVDSTAILCELARQRQARGHTAPILAFSYNAEEFDETPYLDATLRETGATMVPLHLNVRQTWDSLERVLHFHDEPLHSMNALVGFQLMRLARQHGALVILNGQGADETLAGYSSYYTSHWLSLIAQGRVGQARREIAAYAATFGADPRALAANVLRMLMYRVASRLPGYLGASRMARNAIDRRNPWFSAEVTTALPNRGPIESMRLDAVQRVSVMATPLPLYLRVEDRNSMAHGVEVRVPFLDHRLVAQALTLPTHWRMRGQWNKYALRESLRGKIPEVVRTRAEKMGFPMPSAKWFARDLYEPLRDLLGSQSARSRGLFQTDHMLRTIEQARGGEVEAHLELFRAANLETWLTMLQRRRAQAMRPVVKREQLVASG
jgi:asparagine synthase (glutamine-hydrolysing)